VRPVLRRRFLKADGLRIVLQVGVSEEEILKGGQVFKPRKDIALFRLPVGPVIEPTLFDVGKLADKAVNGGNAHALKLFRSDILHHVVIFERRICKRRGGQEVNVFTVVLFPDIIAFFKERHGLCGLSSVIHACFS